MQLNIKKLLACAAFLVSCGELTAQTYAVSAIPDSLKTNANAVVRSEETSFTQTDLNNATQTYSIAITILNENGKSYASVLIPQDKFSSLQSFSGVVLAAEGGKVLKKISKSDLQTFAYSSALISDDKYSVYEYQPSTYPFTIKYEYSTRIKNGIFYYPRFVPIKGYGMAVESAKYTLCLPSSMSYRSKTLQMEQKEPTLVADGNMKSYTWSVANLKAIKKEPLSPSIADIVPKLLLAPKEFCMEGKCGNMDSWTSLGAWLSDLQQGRDDLPVDVKAKLQELTKDAQTDKEKVQRLYEYLQASTRYVSIQLGIGGLQPMSASSVAKSGFGDCKALSNYMKAMLTAVNIPSVYAVISTDNADVYDDFASLDQMNHVILMVPLPNDTLWLECTSALMPFAYAHGNIAGHETLLVMGDKSRLCRLGKPEVCGSQIAKLDLKLDKDGNAVAHVNRTYNLEAFENMVSFAHDMSREEQVNYLLKELNSAKAKISAINIKSDKSDKPSMQLSFDASIDSYANKSGSRLLVPLSMSSFRVGETNLLSRSGERKQPIEIDSRVLRADTLMVEIPEGYVAEALPKSTVVDSEFGSYSTKVSLSGQMLQVVRSFSLNPGKYPASAAQEFQKFLKKVEKELLGIAAFKAITT